MDMIRMYSDQFLNFYAPFPVDVAGGVSLSCSVSSYQRPFSTAKRFAKKLGVNNQTSVKLLRCNGVNINYIFRQIRKLHATNFACAPRSRSEI